MWWEIAPRKALFLSTRGAAPGVGCLRPAGGSTLWGVVTAQQGRGVPAFEERRGVYWPEGRWLQVP